MNRFILAALGLFLSGFFLTPMAMEEREEGIGKISDVPPLWVAEKIVNGEFTNQQIDELDGAEFKKELQYRTNFTGDGWVMPHVRALAAKKIIEITDHNPGYSLKLLSETGMKNYFKEHRALMVELNQQHEQSDED